MVDDGRTTDGRTTEHGYTISSPCEPDGSGELQTHHHVWKPLIDSSWHDTVIIEPRREKTGLRGFRPGPTQTGLYKLRKELEA